MTAVELIQSLNPHELEVRLDELEAEQRAVKILLRAAHTRETLTRFRRAPNNPSNTATAKQGS